MVMSQINLSHQKPKPLLQSPDIIQSLQKLEAELHELRMKIEQKAEMDEPRQSRYISLRGVWKELQNVSDEEIEAAKKLWTVKKEGHQYGKNDD
jgi:hypothetical protein